MSFAQDRHKYPRLLLPAWTRTHCWTKHDELSGSCNTRQSSCAHEDMQPSIPSQRSPRTDPSRRSTRYLRDTRTYSQSTRCAHPYTRTRCPTKSILQGRRSSTIQHSTRVHLCTSTLHWHQALDHKYIRTYPRQRHIACLTHTCTGQRYWVYDQPSTCTF